MTTAGRFSGRAPTANAIAAVKTVVKVSPRARFSTTDTTKLAFIAALVSGMKSRGVPIDGVGHQMHNNVDFPSGQAVVDTINMFSALGVENSITELDVSIYSGSFPTPFTSYTDIPASRHNTVGYSYLGYIQALKQLQGKIVSVTIWGTSDDKTWLNSSSKIDAPLLFDPSLKKKPAYWAFVDPMQLPDELCRELGIERTGAISPSSFAAAVLALPA